MRLKRASTNSQHENTIPLINVVFLMLVFFLIAGTIAPSNDHEINPVTSQLEQQTPPKEAISIRSDGALYFQGELIDIAANIPSGIADLEQLIVYPDQNLSAQIFAEKIAELRTRLNKPVSVLIERKTQ